MVLVEDLAHVGQVDLVLGALGPGKLHQPLEVGPGDRVLGARRLHVLEAVELLEGDLLDLLGHLGLGDLLLKLLDVPRLVVDLAQLPLDRLELLAQHVLALRVPHLLLHLAVDPLADLEDLELAREQGQDLAHALDDVRRLEHVLLLARVDVEVAHDQVGHLGRLGHAVEERGGLLGKLGHEGDELLGRILDVGHERRGLHVPLRVEVVLHRRDLGRDERVEAEPLVDVDPGDALQDDAVVVLGELDHLEDPRRAPHLVQVVGARLLHLPVLLRHHPDDRALVRDGLLDEAHRARAPHVDGDDRAGKEHGVPQREDRKLLRQHHRRLFFVGFGRHGGFSASSQPNTRKGAVNRACGPGGARPTAGRAAPPGRGW